MIRNETRESAHLRSRVKDLSVVPNVVSFTPLLAAITPIAKLEKNSEQLYDPILIRDTDSLIANFGDPRIDPEKYIDLYSIMQLVGNGTSCYVAKVDSGEAGVYKFPFLADPEIVDESEVADNKLTLTKVNDKNIWYVYTNNKYIINGVIGSDDSSNSSADFISDSFDVSLPGWGNEDGKDYYGSLLDSNNPKDYTGSFSWKCVPADEFDQENTDDKQYAIVITLNNNETAPESLVAVGSLDPNWGAEPAKLDLQDGSPTYNAESNKTTAIYKNADKLSRDYVILESSITDVKNKIKDSLTTATDVVVTYKVDDGYITVTVTTSGDNSSDDWLTEIDLRLTRASHSMIAYSSMVEDLTFNVYLTQTKPYSLKIYYLNVEVNNGSNVIGAAKVKLEKSTTNQGLANSLNSSLGSIVHFDLIDKDTAGACPDKDRGANSIVKALFDAYCSGANLTTPQQLEQPVIDCRPSFKVSMNNYIAALEQYKAKKYVGCLMADMTCPVSRDMDNESDESDESVYLPNHEERRALHYNLKQIACERKDCTVVLSTPYYESKDNTTPLTVDDACDWVSSQNKYVDLWEYGTSNTTDYSIQSFYIEIYYSWLKQQCTKIENGLAKSVKVITAPANIVINNIMTSYRERGIHYPVAGDQYGTLPETCEVLMNPKTKASRDTLVQNRINPIYDTGTRGVQIFGNETLNAGYTDLNAAHIARTLVYIRSTINEYTEKLKFSINSLVLWDTWKNYVTNYILEPLKSVNALREYSVKMGTDTTSDDEIANRTINGLVNIIFYQSAEIFDLTYTIYSSATTLEEENAL